MMDLGKCNVGGGCGGGGIEPLPELPPVVFDENDVCCVPWWLLWLCCCCCCCWSDKFLTEISSKILSTCSFNAACCSWNCNNFNNLASSIDIFILKTFPKSRPRSASTITKSPTFKFIKSLLDCCEIEAVVLLLLLLLLLLVVGK